jgi:hypothetical protein
MVKSTANEKQKIIFKLTFTRKSLLYYNNSKIKLIFLKINQF